MPMLHAHCANTSQLSLDGSAVTRKSRHNDTVNDTGVSARRWHLTGTESPLKELEFSLVRGQEEERRKHQHADTSPEKEVGWSWASIYV